MPAPSVLHAATTSVTSDVRMIPHTFAENVGCIHALAHCCCCCCCYEKLSEQAELYESKSSAKKAGKLIKLLIEVERALYSAEAAEIAAQSDPSRAAQYMKDAGLRFLPEPTPPPPPPADDRNTTTSTDTPGVETGDGEGSVGSIAPTATKKASRGKPSSSKTRSKVAAKSSATERRGGVDGGNGVGQKKKKSKKGGKAGGGREQVSRRRGSEDGSAGSSAPSGEPLEAFVVTVAGCEVRCFLMLEEREGEEEGRLVVAVGDSLTGEALLQSLFEEPAVVQLASHGLMRETAYVNRMAFQVLLEFCSA